VSRILFVNDKEGVVRGLKSAVIEGTVKER
jgi:hypothetical protein